MQKTNFVATKLYARVIEVKIQLDEASSQRVANLINLQVNVEISL